MSGREEGDSKQRRARAAHARGLRLAGRGWSQEAARCFGEAVELDPSRAESWNALAASLAESEELEGALHAQLEAVRRAPEHLEYRLHLGTLLHGLGPLLAQASLEAATADEELAPDALLTLGLLHGDLGHPREARRHIEACLTLLPDDPEALRELAALQLEAEEVKEAIGSLRRALEVDPEAPELWMDLARAYAAQRLQSPARDALKRAEEVGAAGPDLALVRGLLAALEGALDEALAALALAYDPANQTDPALGPLPREFLDDPAFDALREHPDFLALLEEAPTR